MKVVVNAVPLLTPRSGVANYIYHTFRALERRSEAELWYHYGVSRSRRLRERPSGVYMQSRGLVKKMGKAYTAYRAGLDGLFRAANLFRRYDLYHETNYIPLPFDGPTVVTVFDLSFHLFPETHPADRIRFMEKYFYPRLGRATRFITISEAVKAEMVRHLGLSAEKIDVTPLGVAPELRRPAPEALEEALRRRGLSEGKYLLYVGTLEPRKNVETIAEAYAKLSPARRAEYPLVLAGGMGWLMEGFEKKLDALGIRSSVRFTGFVPDADLPALYAGAAVFLFPSLYEGFGLPVLEAMACGAPVITSNVSSMPEVAGDAGVLVPPRDAGRLASAIEGLLSDPARRKALSENGCARAAGFTWDRCADMTWDVYRRTL